MTATQIQTSTIKPTNPWAKRNKARTRDVAVASVLPAILAAAVYFVGTAMGATVDPAVLLILGFLPLQLVSAFVVGKKYYGRHGREDALLIVVTIFLSTFVMVLLLSVLWSVISAGAIALRPSFILQNSHYISGTTSLDYGGAGHAIIGTVLAVAIATILTVPLGFGIAVYLTETGGKARGLIRTLVQALSGLPSVVSGLFIYSILVLMGWQTTGFSGSLALLPLMLPTVSRVSEEALRLVPVDLRNGALALGSPTWQAFAKVVFPAARSGLLTAVLLGVARIVGETAPLVLTTTYNNDTNLNPFNGPMAMLPTFIFGYIRNMYDTSIQRGWGGCLVIMILVGVLFVGARVANRKKK
ncbi:MAG: hypothetical protein RLZZ626_323 [Actinomycetota bacterium]|jgi:phosphate transport system permease protein